jgi:hypothetical protein
MKFRVSFTHAEDLVQIKAIQEGITLLEQAG